MAPRRPSNLLSTLGLTVLALAAMGLSGAALLQSPTATPMTSASGTPAPSSAGTPAGPSESVTQSELAAPSESTSVDSTQSDHDGSTVVILGDGYSITSASGLWVPRVADTLGWASVENFSHEGRGYIAKPSTCEISTCSTFAGTIPAVVEEDPDVVVTFGGMADGDQDLSDAAGQYFTALRAALPDAELIAISPVTSEEPAPYFLILHDQTIRAGVEAVGGTFIDVGRPGVGDGDQLSADAQSEIADAIIAALS